MCRNRLLTTLILHNVIVEYYHQFSFLKVSEKGLNGTGDVWNS